MEWVFRTVSEWKEAKQKVCFQTSGGRSIVRNCGSKWLLPDEGMFKLNVDTSLFPGADSFAIGMVIRDHHGTFVAGRTSKYVAPVSVLEAEAIGIKEALSWSMIQGLNGSRIQIETDSLLAACAINSNSINVLETGDVFAECRAILDNYRGINLVFVRKEANKVAHRLARFPCIANFHVDFSSPPNCLLEILSDDLN